MPDDTLKKAEEYTILEKRKTSHPQFCLQNIMYVRYTHTADTQSIPSQSATATGPNTISQIPAMVKIIVIASEFRV